MAMTTTRVEGKEVKNYLKRGSRNPRPPVTVDHKFSEASVVN